MLRALVLATIVGGLIWLARGGGAQNAPPAVTGHWVGVWESYAPPPLEGEPPPRRGPRLPLEARVERLADGRWEATFEGEAGRPYRYRIRMTGRQAGTVVLFQGSADLGPMDGGIYDWIGRATENEFIGFYTSQRYTGTFRLGRPKPATAP